MREEKLLDAEKALPDEALGDVAGGGTALNTLKKKMAASLEKAKSVIESQNSSKNLANLGAMLKEKANR